MSAYRHAPGRTTTTRRPRTGVAVRPVEAWRDLIRAVAALEDCHGPGAATAVAEARAVCAGAPFPVEGEDAKAGAVALLEMARTYARTGEAARGHHRVALAAAAHYCAMRLDIADAQTAAFFRRQSGDD